MNITNSKTTLVSVVTPTYNRKNMMLRAVESVWEQTYRPIEMIVVDDGSTDGTEEIAKNFNDKITKDPFFTFIYVKQKNQGPEMARNKGIKLSRGQYIRFLDSDDWLSPEATKNQMAILIKTGAEVCYGNWQDRFADKNDKDMISLSAGEMSDPIESLLAHKWCPPFCYLMKKKTAIESGGWRKGYKGIDDHDWILRIAYTGARFVHLNKDVGYYCQHSGMRISRDDKATWNLSLKKIIFNSIEWLDKNNAWTEERREALAMSLFYHARRFHKSNNKQQFQECISKLEQIAPYYRPPGFIYPYLTPLVGYDLAETIRQFFRHLIGRTIG